MQGLLGWNLILSLPAILLVAWLSGRLLGVSRGWTATVVTGLVGWLSALALSLAIAQGDPAAPGFGRNLWVFAVVLTRGHRPPRRPPADVDAGDAGRRAAA